MSENGCVTKIHTPPTWPGAQPPPLPHRVHPTLSLYTSAFSSHCIPVFSSSFPPLYPLHLYGEAPGMGPNASVETLRTGKSLTSPPTAWQCASECVKPASYLKTETLKTKYLHQTQTCQNNRASNCMACINTSPLVWCQACRQRHTDGQIGFFFFFFFSTFSPLKRGHYIILQTLPL